MREFLSARTVATVQRQPHPQLRIPGFDGGVDALRDLSSFHPCFVSSSAIQVQEVRGCMYFPFLFLIKASPDQILHGYRE